MEPTKLTRKQYLAKVNNWLANNQEQWQVFAFQLEKMMVLKFRLYSNHSINDGSINHFFA